MSDLDNAINSINESAVKAENTASFLDDMSTFDDQSSVTNPNNGQTVASIPKQVKDRTDELFTAAESEINQAVSDAEQSATDAQDAADSIGRYQGLWPDTGGIADKGDTYQTQSGGVGTGQYFTALQNTTVDPVGDDVNWREVVSVATIPNYTDIVYKASGGNSAVENMIAGVPITISVGDSCQCENGTILKKISDTSSSIDDYLPINDVNIKDFGAVSGVSTPTQISMNTQAIIDAAEYCKSSGVGITGSGHFYIEGDGDIDLRLVSVYFNAIFDFGSDATGFLILGGSSTITRNPRQYIREVASSSPRGLSSPAVKIFGTKNQDITIDRCPSTLLFADNADGGQNTSIAYSTFNFNYVENLSLQGAAKGASAQGGWINENTFNLKRCVKLSVGSLDQDTYSHNNNIFYGGTFEGPDAEIKFSKSSDNTMYNLRLESADDNAISFGADSINNKVVISWVESSADQPVYDFRYQDLGRGNLVFSNDDAAYSNNAVFALNVDTLLMDSPTTPTKYNLYGVGTWTSTDESGTPTATPYVTKQGDWLACPQFSVIARSPRFPISNTRDSQITIDSDGWSVGGGFRAMVHGYNRNRDLITPASGDIVVVGSPDAEFGAYINSSNQSSIKMYVANTSCRFISISVIAGNGAQIFKWLNVSVRNPKVTTITNNDDARFMSAYNVPFNTPALN